MAGSRHVDPAVLARIEGLRMRARQVVEGYIGGVHRSPYLGQSVEFAGHRAYVPGDDTRHIDWKLWARADRLLVKQYEEETDLLTHLVLDCSASMAYAPAGAGLGKADYARTVAACLAMLQQGNRDPVGLVLFDEQVRHHLRPGSSPAHIDTILHLLEHHADSSGTDVDSVFGELCQRLDRRGLVVLISDGLLADPAILQRAFHGLRQRGHEVLLVHILHDHECRLPFDDRCRFVDMEGDGDLLIDPAALRAAYQEVVQSFRETLRQACAAAGVDLLSLSTADPLDAALLAFLAARERRARVLL